MAPVCFGRKHFALFRHLFQYSINGFS
jgi:hypothetical protein